MNCIRCGNKINDLVCGTCNYDMRNCICMAYKLEHTDLDEMSLFFCQKEHVESLLAEDQETQIEDSISLLEDINVESVQIGDNHLIESDVPQDEREVISPRINRTSLDGILYTANMLGIIVAVLVNSLVAAEEYKDYFFNPLLLVVIAAMCVYALTVPDVRCKAVYYKSTFWISIFGMTFIFLINSGPIAMVQIDNGLQHIIFWIVGVIFAGLFSFLFLSVQDIKFKGWQLVAGVSITLLTILLYAIILMDLKNIFSWSNGQNIIVKAILFVVLFILNVPYGVMMFYDNDLHFDKSDWLGWLGEVFGASVAGIVINLLNYLPLVLLIGCTRGIWGWRILCIIVIIVLILVLFSLLDRTSVFRIITRYKSGTIFFFTMTSMVVGFTTCYLIAYFVQGGF